VRPHIEVHEAYFTHCQTGRKAPENISVIFKTVPVLGTNKFRLIWKRIPDLGK
jgi:hypothetical protein